MPVPDHDHVGRAPTLLSWPSAPSGQVPESLGHAMVLCREMEHASAKNAELQVALEAATEALGGAKGAWEQGATWQRRQLAPALQQHDAVLGVCESRLLGLAGEARHVEPPCAGESDKVAIVAKGVVRYIATVRDSLRSFWQELLGDSEEDCGHVGLKDPHTPGLLHIPGVVCETGQSCCSASSAAAVHV